MSASSQKKEAERIRLEEIRHVLQQSIDSNAFLKNWEMQLLALLSDCDVTATTDMDAVSFQKKAETGFGLKNFDAMQTFFQQLCPTGDVDSPCVTIVDPLLADENVTGKRFREMALLLEKIGNASRWKQQAAALKKSENDAKRTRQEVLLNALTVLSPVDKMLADAMAAHGIHTTNDLNKPVHALWVQRGMPGTFVRQQVKLRPDQSYAVLALGLTQDEIAVATKKNVVEKATAAFMDSLDRFFDGRAEPMDVERVAVLAAHGVMSKEALTAPEGIALMQNGMALLDEAGKGYNNAGDVKGQADEYGLAVKLRAPDVDKMVSSYMATGVIPTLSEIRLTQARVVLEKVTAGRKLDEWEDVLYAGLAIKGIDSVAALSDDVNKTCVEDGLTGSFVTDTPRGFNALTLKHLTPVAAHKMMMFRSAVSDKKVPARADVTTLTPEQKINALHFAVRMEAAYAAFERGDVLTHVQEEMIAVGVAHGIPDDAAALRLAADPLISAVATDIALWDKIEEGHDFATGDVLETVKTDYDDFIVGKEYEENVKEYILKLRAVSADEDGCRVLPARIVPENERAEIMKDFSKIMSRVDMYEKRVEIPRAAAKEKQKKASSRLRSFFSGKR